MLALILFLAVLVFGFWLLIRFGLWLGKAISAPGKSAYEAACRKFKLQPDYVSSLRSIAIESATRRVMLNTSQGYRVYEPGEVSAWSSGWDTLIAMGRQHYKYYIEFRVKDLDDPNPKAWFGGNHHERDLWYARITTMFNG